MVRPEFRGLEKIYQAATEYQAILALDEFSNQP